MSPSKSQSADKIKILKKLVIGRLSNLQKGG